MQRWEDREHVALDLRGFVPPNTRMAPGLPPRGGAPFRLLGHVLLLALLSGSAQAQRRTATIAGVVRDSLGTLIPGVDVAVAGSGLRARTDPEGAYRIVGLLPGPATLTARRLGFRPHSQQLRLEAGEERTIEIRLAASAELLSRIQVTAPRETAL